MNEIVKTILIKSGWYEGRNVDISDYVEWYISEGYNLPTNIKAFLKEFGGLNITVPRHSCRNGMNQIFYEELTVDPVSNGFEFEFIGKYNHFFNADLYPIGVSTFTPDFFMDSAGAFYAMYGDIGIKGGDSFEEFIMNILNDDIAELKPIY